MLNILTFAYAESPIDPWQQMTWRDLEAIKGNIQEGHPGMVDPANPTFKEILESGYKQAQAAIPQVNSYDGYKAVIDRFMTEFHEGHLYVNPHVEKVFVLWPKIILQYKQNSFVVAVREEDKDLPPIGAKLISCDGIAVREVILERLFPYQGLLPHLESEWQRLTPFLLVDEGNPFLTPLKECAFEIDDKVINFPLAWQRISLCDWNERIKELNRIRTAQEFGIRETAHGGVWVSIPSFNAKSPQNLAALNQIIDKIGQYQKADYIVIDLRGNGGGNSAFGEKLIEQLFGKETLEWLDNKYNTFAEWRASKISISYLESALQYLEKALGKDSPVYESFTQDLVNIKEAVKRGIPLVRSAESQKWPEAGATPPPTPLKAKIFVVTDGFCGSSCLSFCDLILHYPGVIQVGLPTFGDNAYTEAMQIPLPSGLGTLIMSVKILRNLPRKDYAPYSPQYRFEGNMDDTPALEEWIWQIIQDKKREL